MNGYTKDEHYHEAIDIIKEYVEKYANVENLEIEFRLGYIEDEKFKPGISREFFDKIQANLVGSPVWSNVVTERTVDYFNSNKRITRHENGDTVCIKKEKLAMVDFAFLGSGFDVRVSFSTENPEEAFDIGDSTYERKKNRVSYEYKHLSYDMTEVIMEDNGVEDHIYEVEIEVKKLDLKNMSSHYLVHDALLKITDLIKMCEEVDDEFRLEFQKEKIFKKF